VRGQASQRIVNRAGHGVPNQAHDAAWRELAALDEPAKLGRQQAGHEAVLASQHADVLPAVTGLGAGSQCTHMTLVLHSAPFCVISAWETQILLSQRSANAQQQGVAFIHLRLG